MWLSILLVLRLHAKPPTFYQRRLDEVYYFTEDGVQSIPLRNGVAFLAAAELTPHAWALVDSDLDINGVDPLYFDLLFIVQTPSPRASRMRWEKKTSLPIDLFILKPWTLPELLCG